MKKNLFIFIAGLMLFLASCEGPMGPPGRDGRPGQDVVLYNFPVEVRNSNWEHTWVHQGGGTYTAEIPIPELSANIFNNGGVIMVFREWFDAGVSNWVVTPLPQTIPGIGGIITDIDGYPVFDDFGYPIFYTWTEHFNFDFTAGMLWIDFKTSDFIDRGSPGIQFFRVLVIR